MTTRHPVNPPGCLVLFMVADAQGPGDASCRPAAESAQADFA
jgi:hypothetical protein